jgi:hypothetical protein
MGLPWVRLDSTIAQNPKILTLVEDKNWQSITVYVCGLGYSGTNGTDGFIPRSALPFIHGRPRDADILVEVGLWHERPGGWDVNGWHEYQPTSEEHQKRRERAQRAAAKRWSTVHADV